MKEFTCITLGPLYCYQKRAFSLPFYHQSCFKEASSTLPNKSFAWAKDATAWGCSAATHGPCAAAAPSRHASLHMHGMEGPAGSSSLRAPKLCLISIVACCGGSRSAQPSTGGVGSLRCVAMTPFAVCNSWEHMALCLVCLFVLGFLFLSILVYCHK